jgi:gamma-glutamylcyclotransferase (GGCT)/AIG2-like uncharacterized protein YtfP
MNVFVYGTLLVPKIWETVTATTGLVSHPSELAGYEIRRVRDAVFPGIVAAPREGTRVNGRVFFDVPAEALRRLDAYEDDFYLREEVHPVVTGMGPVPAQAYLVPPGDAERILSSDPWTLEWFEENGLEGFWSRVFAP